jgi:hypothetical protein
MKVWPILVNFNYVINLPFGVAFCMAHIYDKPCNLFQIVASLAILAGMLWPTGGGQWEHTAPQVPLPSMLENSTTYPLI